MRTCVALLAWLWSGIGLAVDPFAPFLPCVNTLLDSVDVAAEFEPAGEVLDHFDLGLLGLALEPEQSFLNSTQARLVQFDAVLRPLYLQGHLELALATQWYNEGVRSYEAVRDAFAKFSERYAEVEDQLAFLSRVALRTIQSAGDVEKLLGKEEVQQLIRSNFAELRLLILYHVALARPRVIARVANFIESIPSSPSLSFAFLPAWPEILPEGPTRLVAAYDSASLGRFLRGLNPMTRLLFIQTHEYYFSDQDRTLFAEVYPDTARVLLSRNGVRLRGGD
ncbi:MAG: hypothetical protein KDD39_07855 [Bdellovibrionales bacterium]|nr:hypothetical protein [Bdellovibrionales bacterium]